MRVHSFSLKQIHQFKTLTLDFESGTPDTAITVLLGEQNTGKSLILKNLFHTLSWFAARFKDLRSAGIVIAEQDMRPDASQAALSITIQYPDVLGITTEDKYTADITHSCTWTIRKIKTQTSSIGISRVDTAELDLLIPHYQKQLEQDPHFGLPCIAYYPAQRFVHELNLHAKNNSVLHTQHAYDLTTSQFTTFSKFFEWLREIYDLENAQAAALLRQYLQPNTRFHTQEQLDELFSSLEQGYRHSSQRCMTSLRRALKSMFHDIDDIWIDLHTQPTLMIKQGEKNLAYMSLSPTYRAWVALIGDIVRRACLLHPKSLYPELEVEGVIIIDEIDAHLDTTHRQHILANLQHTFPRLQFIISSLHDDIIDEPASIECYQITALHASKYQLDEYQQQLDAIYQQLDSTTLLDSHTEPDNNSENPLNTTTYSVTQLLALSQQLEPIQQQELLLQLQALLHTED